MYILVIYDYNLKKKKKVRMAFLKTIKVTFSTFVLFFPFLP